MFWLTKFFTKGKSVKDAIKYFHTLNGRMPNNLEAIKIKNAFMEQNRGANVIQFPKAKITNPFEPRPGDVKKIDEDPYQALLDRQIEETEKITPEKYPGMSFYGAMLDNMKKHKLEKLEFEYDEMFNKLSDKAKRIEADPKVLLEAELGTKLTGEETTTQLLDLFKNRPKKASGGLAREGYFKGKIVKSLLKPKKIKLSEADFDVAKGLDDLENIRGTKASEIMTIKLKYPGISDDLIRNIMVDDNPQRKAEVFATLDEAFKMMEKGKSEDEIIKIFKDTSRTKQASGGIAGQLHLYEGGRVPMIFGGSAGLRGAIASIKAALNKGRKDKIKKLFPTYSVEEKELLKLGEKYLPKDAANLAAQEAAGKAEGVQVLIDRLKHDKKMLKQIKESTAKNDPNLDFLMKELEDMYSPHLKKYTDIDKDILQLETIKKNLIMKDRQLNAEGGRASLSNGGLANILGV